MTEIDTSKYEPPSEEDSAAYRERHALRAGRRRAAGYYTPDEAAGTLAEQLGIDDSLARSVAAHNLCKAIRASVELGTLCRHQWSDALGGFADPKAGKYVFAREVNAWLKQIRKPSNLRLPEPRDEPEAKEDDPPKAVQKQTAQDAAILAKLAQLGFDAQALPPVPKGKASPVKQAVREALGYSTDVMKKAWQRLLDHKRIKYA